MIKRSIFSSQQQKSRKVYSYCVKGSRFFQPPSPNPNPWKSMILLHAIQFQLKGCFTKHTWSLQRRAGTLVIQKSHSREGTCAMAKAR